MAGVEYSQITYEARGDVAVMTGAGRRFCAGADMQDLPACWASPEHAGAVQALMAKRTPLFTR